MADASSVYVCDDLRLSANLYVIRLIYRHLYSKGC